MSARKFNKEIFTMWTLLVEAITGKKTNLIMNLITGYIDIFCGLPVSQKYAQFDVGSLQYQRRIRNSSRTVCPKRYG